MCFETHPSADTGFETGIATVSASKARLKIIFLPVRQMVVRDTCSTDLTDKLIGINAEVR